MISMTYSGGSARFRKVPHHFLLPFSIKSSALSIQLDALRMRLTSFNDGASVRLSILWIVPRDVSALSAMPVAETPCSARYLLSGCLSITSTCSVLRNKVQEGRLTRL